MRATRKHLVVAGAVVLGVGGLFLSPAIAQTQDHKITICHVPLGNPDNAHEITVDLHAWEAGHSPDNGHSEDFVVDADNQCGLDDGTTTTSTSTTSTTTVGTPGQ
jgi:hypothetical protein